MRWLLVASQFVLAAWIVLGTDWRWPDSVLPIVLAIPGAVLAVWAWVAMGIRRLRVQPDVAHDARLVTGPPYRWIRHPMYAGLLAFTLPLVLFDFGLWRITMWMLLALVLEAKSRIEERLLRRHFDTYEAYVQTSWKFLPGIY
jgi:protein-S-isoprenylcysteine O-methyltransferase Ste14